MEGKFTLNEIKEAYWREFGKRKIKESSLNEFYKEGQFEFFETWKRFYEALESIVRGDLIAIKKRKISKNCKR